MYLPSRKSILIGSVGQRRSQYNLNERNTKNLTRWTSMGLSWQQGPLSSGAIGRFLVPEPLPKRLLYLEPLRRRMRVRFGGNWIADSERVLLLFEPGHYPMAYFPATDISPDTLHGTEHITRHPDLGHTSWYAVEAGEKKAQRGAWQHIDLPAYARIRRTDCFRMAGHERLLRRRRTNCRSRC